MSYYLIRNYKYSTFDLKPNFSGKDNSNLQHPPRVLTIPLRVPASLPPSQGVLRLHSKQTCQPFVDKISNDEKCPENCTTGNCIVIPFQLASSIRQILLITDQTHYRRGQKGKKNDKRYLIL